MDILVGCEKFGAVRDALIAYGHNAVSCDIEDTDSPGPHIKGYLEDVLYSKRWDLLITFPPCTYLSSSGLWRNKYTSGRAEKTKQALAFVCMILNHPCQKIALENPVGCISTRIACVDGVYTVMPLNSKDQYEPIKPTQIIHPYQFGHDASKSTCLFLKGLPPLTPTKYIQPRIVTYKGKQYKRWANQTDSGQNRLGPSPDRAALRGKTYPGIAEAMAQQWGGFEWL